MTKRERVIRAHLLRSLPEHMVPVSFIRVESFPRLPNGKIARTALPAPDWRARSEGAAVPPRTRNEEFVAETWSSVLKVSPLGIYDDFFQLGGHSLLSTQILSRLRARFGIDIPLRYLFDYPTVAALAEQIGVLLSLRAPPPAAGIAVDKDTETGTL